MTIRIKFEGGRKTGGEERMNRKATAANLYKKEHKGVIRSKRLEGWNIFRVHRDAGENRKDRKATCRIEGEFRKSGWRGLHQQREQGSGIAKRGWHHKWVNEPERVQWNAIMVVLAWERSWVHEGIHSKDVRSRIDSVSKKISALKVVDVWGRNCESRCKKKVDRAMGKQRRNRCRSAEVSVTAEKAPDEETEKSRDMG